MKLILGNIVQIIGAVIYFTGSMFIIDDASYGQLLQDIGMYTVIATMLFLVTTVSASKVAMQRDKIKYILVLLTPVFLALIFLNKGALLWRWALPPAMLILSNLICMLFLRSRVFPNGI